jgi:hypothetical protein
MVGVIVHIVFWKLHETGANGKSREENALEMRRRFAALMGVIPGLLKVETGIDLLRTGDSVDVCLYTEFESMAALEAYNPHPAHKEIIAFLKDVRYERRVIDYERP